MVFAAHGPGPASPPTATSFVLPVTVSGPATKTPQSRTTPAPVACTAPATVPPWRSTVPPDLIVSGPACSPPAAMQTASPGATVTGPADSPVRHGRVYVTVSVPGANAKP